MSRSHQRRACLAVHLDGPTSLPTTAAFNATYRLLLRNVGARLAESAD